MCTLLQIKSGLEGFRDLPEGSQQGSLGQTLNNRPSELYAVYVAEWKGGSLLCCHGWECLWEGHPPPRPTSAGVLHIP